MKKILLSCVTCLLALGLVTACDTEEEEKGSGGDDSTTQESDTTTSSDETTQGGDTTETFVIEREGTVNVHIGAKNSGSNSLTSGVNLYAKAGHQWQSDYQTSDDSFPMVWEDSNHALVAATGSETDVNLSAADLWYTVEGWSSVMPIELVIFGASADTDTDAYWTSYVLPSPDVDGSGEEYLNFWTTTQSDHYAGLSLDWVSDETMEGVTDIYVVFTFDFSGVTTTGPYTTDVTWSVTTASITPEEEE